MSAGESERQLVEKVELRLALADDDKKFEKGISTYLAPVLLKFASPHPSVKAQVGKTVKFLLTRINASPAMKLPVEALLKQVQDPQVKPGEDPTLVQSYTLVFLSKGIGRLSKEEQSALIPKVIHGISHHKPIIAARLFNILCKLILEYDTTQLTTDDGKKFREFLALDEGADNHGEEQYLLDKFADFMLLQPVKPNDQGQIPKGFSLPGLSKNDCAFFTYNAGVTFDSAMLTKYKRAILKFIEYGFGPESNLALLNGSADANSAVADLASNLFRRRQIDHENEAMVGKLISLFLGDPTVSRPPARRQLQEKIMNYLTQSNYAAKSPQAGKLMSLGLNSDYGKLKKSTVGFIRAVTTQMAQSDDSEQSADDAQLNSDMAAQLRTSLQSEKQTEISSGMQDYLLQRRYQYEALSLLLKRARNVADMSYIQFLFDMLQTEIPELRASAQDALSSVTVHLPELSNDDRERLKQLLKSIIQSPVKVSSKDLRDNELAARYMAAKFTNVAFPFKDPEARLLDIEVQTKDDKPETIEEATKGLNPYWFNILQSSNSKEYKPSSEIDGSTVEFPSFKSIIQYLASECNDSNLDKAIVFSLQCLVMQSVKGVKTVIVPDKEWDNRIDNAIDFDPMVRKCITKELSRLSQQSVDADGDSDMDGSSPESSLDVFLKICFEYFTKTLNLDVAKRLTNIISLCPQETVGHLVGEVPSLVKVLPDTFSSDASQYVSEMLGILCSHKACSNEVVVSTMDQLIQSEDIRPLGYIISRLALTNRLSLVTTSMFQAVLKLVSKYLDSASSFKSGASVDCISQLAMFGCLGPKIALSDDAAEYKSAYAKTIEPWIKKRQSDLTAMSWAYLGMSGLSKQEKAGDNDEADTLNHFEQVLYDSHVTKHADYLFSTGEALSVLAYGWKSHIMDGKIDVQNAPVSIDSLIPSIDRVSVILKSVLKACASTKPSLRKAGCIWLLSLVQNCGDSVAVKSNLNQIQVAFMKFLSDKDYLVQESASRGLSMVYEKGDYELQDELVHNLLLSFTDSSKANTLMSGSVGADTELFEPGVLKTDDGSVSTYKDILNLASEVGDPSLVYKFMSLAKNSALWSSRKGIAYGLGAVLDKSKLDEMLQKDQRLSGNLIPKLYRYRFDPSPTVSKTMDDIWNSLIVDSNKAIQDNFDSILKTLLKDMGNREWRVRQASAAALSDLLRQVPLDMYEDKLEKIWSMAFRSMDDIKDSVRKEGNQLTRYLATTMVHKITDNKKGSEETLKQLIPFLLGNNGLLSDAEDVKSFAFDTILKIADTASVALKPFVNEMIEQMVMLMSSVEPQVVNYLSLNADKYKLKTEDLDVQRLNMVGSSPMMSAIEKLMNLLDDSLMPDFVVKLNNAVKSSVGLPSKVTGSKVIVDLIVRHFFVAQNYADDLLKIAMGQLKDRNDTISGSYAIAAGYAIRTASEKKINVLSKKLKRYYFESPADNNHLQKASSRASAAIADYSKDKFQSIATGFLPLAFIGKHDLDEKVAAGFKKTWDSSIGSGTNAIKLYFDEIMELVKEHIDTTNFSLRQTIGLSIIEIVDKLGPQIGTMGKHLDDMYTVLLDSLKGRTYEGKEKLLHSLVLLAINSKDYLKDHPELYQEVAKKITGEAQRKKKDYKKHSVKALGKFLGSGAHDTDLYETYVGLVHGMLHPSAAVNGDDNDSSMDTDSDSDVDARGSSNLKKMRIAKQEEFRNSLLENLVIAVNRNEPNQKLVEYILTDALPAIALEDSTYKTKLVAINVLTELINKLDHSERLDDSRPLLMALWQKLANVCTTKNDLQSVLVNFSRLSKLVGTKVVTTEAEKVQVRDALQSIIDEDINSVVTTEAQKALATV